MKILGWSIVVIIGIFQIKPALSKFPCKRTEKCVCYHSYGNEYELQCPPVDYGDEAAKGVVIHINKKVEIDCHNLVSFDANIISSINASDAEGIRMKYCPLPLNGTFSEVLSKFNLLDTSQLSFEFSESKNLTLNKEVFDGLESLKYIELSKDLNLDQDVFENTPNLTYVDIGNNKVNLTEGLFTSTPLINILIMSENELTSIPEGLLDSLEQLRTLQLWRNNLTIVEDHYFRNLSSLKSLELSFNHIESISSNAFDGLINLEQLSLNFNKIGRIPRELFRNTKKLNIILLNSNTNVEISNYSFANLPQLKTVNASYCNLTYLPNYTFNGSNALEVLDLRNNQISDLPDEFLTDILSLKQLILFANKFIRVPKFIQHLKGLVELDLQYNLIERLQPNNFEGLSKLEKILLQFNKITIIDATTFYGCKDSLKYLYLSHNSYNEQMSITSPFNPCTNLQVLDLSFNEFTFFEWNEFFISNTNLRILDLENNKIQNPITFNTLFATTSNTVTIKLDNNNITMVDFSDAERTINEQPYEDALTYKNPFAKISMNNNPINCDCHMYDLARYVHGRIDERIPATVNVKTENLRCQNPIELFNITIDKLPMLAFQCDFKLLGYSDACPDECACSWRPEDRAVVVDCSGRNLKNVPMIDLSNINLRYEQSEIHLEDNLLLEAPTRRRLKANNVTKLHLSNNNITELVWIPPNLQILKIDNNNLSRISFEVLKSLNTSNLQHLSVYNNPWNCDCEALNFTEFLSNNLKKLDDNRPVQCRGTTSKLLTKINRTELCGEWKVIYYVLPILLILLILTTCVALYTRYEFEIKVLLYSRNLCLWWVTEDELDKDKIYDVFISYHHDDEDFVTDEILPELEKGPKPYKTCVHYRNWLVGEYIAKQVCDSVRDSRRTLVVLSPNFLKSVWGKVEFRTAHTQAMSDGRARLIVVLLGEIDTDSLDSEFKAYMKTNTYLKWGDPWFWDKMRYALPHSKLAIRRNLQRHTNIMNTIDDKFKLVPVEKKVNDTSHETTPPIDRLEAGLLQKNPPNFLNKINENGYTAPAESGLVTSVEDTVTT